MITDQELASALHGRPHWQPLAEDSAIYEPPGQPASVRVGRIRQPARQGSNRHNRYYATVVRDGRALHAAQFGFAAETVRWAERVNLS